MRLVAPAAIVIVATAPHDVERIPFAAALSIFYADDGDAAIGRVADQVLAPAAIDAAEAEVVWPCGHGLVTVESTPSGALADARAQAGGGAADLDFGGAIDFDFNRTFSVTVPTAPSDVGGSCLFAAPLGESAACGEKDETGEFSRHGGSFPLNSIIDRVDRLACQSCRGDKFFAPYPAIHIY